MGGDVGGDVGGGCKEIRGLGSAEGKNVELIKD